MPSTYRLLPQLEYDSIRDGIPFQVGARTKWDFNLFVSKVSPGGSVEVVLEGGSTSEDDDWNELVSFGVVSTASTVKKEAAPSGQDFSINLVRDTWIRARVKTIVGRVILEVWGEGIFLNDTIPEDLEYLDKELRDWKDGRSRILKQAEFDVMGLLLVDSDDGTLDIDLTDPGASEAIKIEIARQASYLRQKEVLGRSSDPAAIKIANEMGPLAPGLGRRFRKYRPASAVVWFGR